MQNLDNTVIKVLNKEHGAKVIAFYEKNGYNTGPYSGTNIGYHYGILNNKFLWCTDSDMERYPLKIIELPEENVYPKVMLVSDCPMTKGWRKRVVFMEKMGGYLAWANSETIEESEKEFETCTWDYAVNVPKENPQKTEMLKRVEELKYNIAKMQKQVDEIEVEIKKT